MESILFWVIHCQECLAELIVASPEDKEVSKDLYVTVCPACGKASEYVLAIGITRSKLDKLDRDSLINLKSTINGLIEKKTAEMKP